MNAKTVSRTTLFFAVAIAVLVGYWVGTNETKNTPVSQASQNDLDDQSDTVTVSVSLNDVTNSTAPVSPASNEGNEAYEEEVMELWEKCQKEQSASWEIYRSKTQPAISHWCRTEKMVRNSIKEKDPVAYIEFVTAERALDRAKEAKLKSRSSFAEWKEVEVAWNESKKIEDEEWPKHQQRKNEALAKFNKGKDAAKVKYAIAAE